MLQHMLTHCLTRNWSTSCSYEPLTSMPPRDRKI